MKLYSNEIVFRGHPDKVCDQISALPSEYKSCGYFCLNSSYLLANFCKITCAVGNNSTVSLQAYPNIIP